MSLPPLEGPALLLAERGAAAHAAPDTLDAFRLARRLGADGVVSGAWRTEDGVVVVRRDPALGGIRKRSVAQIRSDELPESLVTLDALVDSLDGAVVALDVADREVAESVVTTARRLEVADRVWLRHPDLATLAGWRAEFGDIRLVNVTRLRSVTGGPERRAADLRDAGIDAIDLHVSDWTAGMVSLFHRFRRLTWGRDAQQERMAVELLGNGVDVITGEYPDRLADAVARVGGA